MNQIHTNGTHFMQKTKNDNKNPRQGDAVRKTSDECLTVGN
jgi:hypothetical protein